MVQARRRILITCGSPEGKQPACLLPVMFRLVPCRAGDLVLWDSGALTLAIHMPKAVGVFHFGQAQQTWCLMQVALRTVVDQQCAGRVQDVASCNDPKSFLPLSPHSPPNELLRAVVYVRRTHLPLMSIHCSVSACLSLAQVCMTPRHWASPAALRARRLAYVQGLLGSQFLSTNAI